MSERTIHEERFFQLMGKSNTRWTDVERKGLFYILAQEDLYLKINKLYDFENNWILPENIENGGVDLSGGMRAMVTLAFNLYNGYECESPVDIFSRLDSENFEICMTAIHMRFDR